MFLYEFNKIAQKYTNDYLARMWNSCAEYEHDCYRDILQPFPTHNFQRKEPHPTKDIVFWAFIEQQDTCISQSKNNVMIT